MLVLSTSDEVLVEDEDLVLKNRGQRDDAPEDREELLWVSPHEVRRDSKTVRGDAVGHKFLVAPVLGHGRSLEGPLRTPRFSAPFDRLHQYVRLSGRSGTIGDPMTSETRRQAF